MIFPEAQHGTADSPLGVHTEHLHDLVCSPPRTQREDYISISSAVFHFHAHNATVAAGKLKTQQSKEIENLFGGVAVLLTEIFLKFSKYRRIFTPGKLLVHGDFFLLIGNVVRREKRFYGQLDFHICFCLKLTALTRL